MKNYDVIIIGGSYAGLASAMALGRSLRNVLVIDSGLPCNRQTPFSHNFITQDGVPPAQIAATAKAQVAQYPTVTFYNGQATNGTQTSSGFTITTNTNNTFTAKKLVFATGVKDVMLPIDGFAQCWGISVLHCPYCHGYEVKNEITGIIASGEQAAEYAMFINNWTKQLTLYTNGPANIPEEALAKLTSLHIKVVTTKINALNHTNGYLNYIELADGTTQTLKAIYAHVPFEQHCAIPAHLGCELDENGFITVNKLMQTTVAGVYACGDNTTQMRSVANAVANGTVAGAMVNREFIFDQF